MRRVNQFITLITHVFVVYPVVAAEFSNAQCEFTVRFESDYRKYNVSDGVHSYAAGELMINQSLTRAECFPIDPAYILDAETQSQQILAPFARANGLSNFSIETVELRPYPSFKLRGYKNIQETPVIYETHLTWGRKSILFQTVAAAASAFPTAETSSFLRSRKLKN